MKHFLKVSNIRITEDSIKSCIELNKTLIEIDSTWEELEIQLSILDKKDINRILRSFRASAIDLKIPKAISAIDALITKNQLK